MDNVVRDIDGVNQPQLSEILPWQRLSEPDC